MVREAVRRQLIADVPLGCFLSGGADSSVIAAAMRAAVPPDQPVLTFSIGFEDQRYDETPFAREVAAHLGTEHRQFIVQPNAAEELPRLAHVFGEPFGDSSALPTHYLARETRRHVKVALSGDGGDELFGGYDRYLAMRLGRRIQRVPAPVLAWARRLAGAPGAGAHPKSRRSRIQRLLATIHQRPALRYASYLRLFADDQIRALLRPELLAASTPPDTQRAVTYRYDELLAGRDEVQAALALDRELYLPEDLLYKTDRCSMLHALEVRCPFMDHDLVHFAASLTTDQLIGGGRKRLLREAFAPDLPNAVFKRPKMGFAVPIGDWLRTSLRDMLRGLLDGPASFTEDHLHRPAVMRLVEEHETQARDHSQRLYALLMLELWWRQRV
jgi:asparagine synthase (glutamine-hydrolysing)